jgi:UDP-N-acetylmuramate--alanine ligase
MMEIYPAREDPIPGVSSRIIFDQVGLQEKVLVSREQVMKVVKAQEPELLVTMGAGDINQFVDPIREWYRRK